MSQENIDVARALHEAFAAKNQQVAASLVADDFEWKIVPMNLALRGKEGFRQGFESFATAFPDSRLHYKQVIDNGDQVVVEYDLIGTHNGALMTPQGAVPPTGRPISVPGIEVFRIRNGKVAALHTYFDNGTLMAQIGALPR
jgi:steroid delta-isomerase-like uncharacterized protein